MTSNNAVTFDDLDDLDSAPVDFSDLDTWAEVEHAAKQPDTRQTYPCHYCQGTGVYQGVRYHQEKSHCFACRGKGHFLSSPQDRAKAKLKRVQKKLAAEQQLQVDLAAWKEEYEALYSYMEEVQHWNDFARSLLEQVKAKASLSEKQMQALYRMYAKHLDREAEKEKQKEADAAARPVVDMTRILELFETAKGNQIKRPKFRAEGLTLSPAPETGANAGAIYVKDGDAYLGKIVPVTGKWTPVYAAKDRKDVEESLLKISKDPLESAKAYGQRTGNCSCCGRELTNHASIDLGIGPICASKWGM